MERYKVKKFGKINAGIGKNVFEENKRGVTGLSTITIDDKGAPIVAGTKTSFSLDADLMTHHELGNKICVFKGYQFLVLATEDFEVKVYRRKTVAENWSLVATITDWAEENDLPIIWGIRDTLYITSTGTGIIFYSEDLGESWTEREIEFPFNQWIDYVNDKANLPREILNTIYFFKENKLFETNEELTTINEIYEFSELYRITSCEDIEGILIILGTRHNPEGGGSKLTTKHVIIEFNPLTKSVKTLKEFEHKGGNYNFPSVFGRMGQNLYFPQFLKNNNRIWKFDGIDFIYKEILQGVDASNLCLCFYGELNEKLFFSIFSDHDCEEAPFTEYSAKLHFITENFNFFFNVLDIEVQYYAIPTIYIFDEHVTLVYYDITGNASVEFKTYRLRNDLQNTYGEYILPTIDESIIAKQLLIKHEALEAGMSVEVYYSINGGTSYTLLGTSNTTGSINKRLTFAKGVEGSEIKFKIKITPNTGTTKSPENLRFEFIYINSGLENAQ